MIRTALLALAATAALSAPVLAQDVHLTYGDLDLSQAGGARSFSQRIDAKATDWCAQQSPLTGTRLRDANCALRVRQELVESLPRTARRAYDAGLLAAKTQVASARAE